MSISRMIEDKARLMAENERLTAINADLTGILENIERELGALEVDWKDGPTTLGEIVRAVLDKA